MFLAPKNSWAPSAPLSHLKTRAAMLARIRYFFEERGVWEVETPLLGKSTIPDPTIHSLTVNFTRLKVAQPLYLQTSPEFYMKRLLAAGSGSIYQISKVFRDDEQGQRHHPEFTMLEWYRVDWHYHQLMDEVEALCRYLIDMPQAQRISYTQLFQSYVQKDPHTASTDELRVLASAHLSGVDALDLDKDGWLNLILAEIIEPQLDPQQPLFIYDFPATQAALARIRHETIPVAERFELYYQGLELANGFQELTDANEQYQRFIADNQKRSQINLPLVPIDEELLTALANGLPYCSGVAMGLDRLLMLATQSNQISHVLAFTLATNQ